ncbi:MAG: DNA-formamidopyrimidine glycosylase family protein, partial [Patescibacteria group bacterium]
MPELPEVETLKRELSRKLVGKTIAKTEVNWAKMVAPLSPAELGRELKGEKIAAIERRAKILIITLVGKKLILIHLKMTGQLIFQDVRHPHKLVVGGHPQKEPFTHTRLILHFQDGSKLLFNDLRKFGWLKLLNHSES